MSAPKNPHGIVRVLPHKPACGRRSNAQEGVLLTGHVGFLFRSTSLDCCCLEHKWHCREAPLIINARMQTCPSASTERALAD